MDRPDACSLWLTNFAAERNGWDSVFIKLQDEIAEIEENLQAARSNYNSNVASYNKSISVFPNSLVAGSKFIKREYFEAEDIKREDVKIEF